MLKRREVVENLVCRCGARIITDGKLTCPRCHSHINMASSQDVAIDAEGRWKCQKCLEHGHRPKTLAIGDKIQCRQCKKENKLAEKEEREMSQVNGKKIELSCKEARLILKVMGIDTIYEGMKPEEFAACFHYSRCEDCQKIGLSEILSQQLTCQKALEVWAKNPGPLYLGFAKMVKEQLAVEHVWGRAVKKSVTGGGEPSEFVDSHFGACFEPPCQQLLRYWASAPLCSHYDGEKEIAEEIPFLIQVFLRQGWSLKKLLEIQKQRLTALFKALGDRKIPGEWGYHSVTDVIYEIEANVCVLQRLLLEQQKNPRGFAEIYSEITG